MNQPQFAKYTNVLASKEAETSARRLRPARESEPPMMSNNFIYEKSAQMQAPKNKPTQPLDYANRMNTKYLIQQSDADRFGQPVKSINSVKAGEHNTSNKEVGQSAANQQNYRGQPAQRFMSPELKSVGPIGHKPQQRKYSSQIGDTHLNSKSITQLPGAMSEHGLHRSNTDPVHSHGINTSNRTVTSNTNSPTAPPKRQPRFSEPVNFSMDMMDEPAEPANTSMHQVSDDSKISVKLKEPQKTPIQQSPPNTTKTAFKKQKELKETVSTHSTFHSITEGPRTFQRLDSKVSSHTARSPQPPKLSDFKKGKEIGSGKFGSVFIVKYTICKYRHKVTGFVCAMKAIPKEIIKEENILNQLTRELKIQMYLDHPNIIKLYGFFHDKDNIYLLLELGSSGQLYKVIKQRQRLSEASTAYTIKQVCQAIRYLHFFKIIHRDLKPENIVIQSGTVKLCDFGWAVARGTELRSTFCGTPLYVSPQILKGQHYDEKIDLWSIGILTFQLLFGNIPFQINREQELIKIIKEDIVFPQHIKVSDDAKDFILNILKKNPGERLKIGELLEHNFLKKCPELAPELEY